ncbi:hypothetical protein CI610_02855 [invertebrate metagenome]|uniref:Pyrimidine/purine nucleotide 5'-monophosphate nucleosidase C-terminal domain-containing protein n=1 Tax=invertebrate metagenome TaxID=1711999 RepID=A0A2H9T4P9_9ZZZZ
MIRGIRQNLFSVLRDILYVNTHFTQQPSQISSHNDNNSADTTHIIFSILRHARAFISKQPPDTIVCWGGHSISKEEYAYTKVVGYQLGLRNLNICTGCGPGAMKGPMKGAYIGHAKQRNNQGRFIGLTEPGIIAAEAPNPIVNELVILPDIEKRLEAFVRFGHGIIVFPGGPGTCEEILYILGILLDPANQAIPFPLVFTGPESASPYFEQIDRFIGTTLGTEAQQRYQIIINDPQRVADTMKRGLETVTHFRRQKNDAYYFNWMLRVRPEFQTPFIPNHHNMAELAINSTLPSYQLAANLRQLMSGIVAGNIKEEGRQHIREKGPYQLSGEKTIMDEMDKLLTAFIQQQRMKLPGQKYEPCYKISH